MMASYKKISELFDANPFILRILVNSNNLAEARRDLGAYLNRCEEEINSTDCNLHPLEKKNTRQCIEVFRNLIAPINEAKTKHSCLNTLWKLATEHWRKKEWSEISDGFLEDMRHLVKGVIGLSGIYSKSGICKREVPAFVNLSGREAAIVRSTSLDEKATMYKLFCKKNDYRSGLETEFKEKRLENRKIILEALGATETDWKSHDWHLKNMLRSPSQLKKLVDLSEEEIANLSLAMEKCVPSGISPFYASLFDPKGSEKRRDGSLRAHVIPSKQYIEKVAEAGEDKFELLDFMREADTSPVDLVTRRYPLVAILKACNACFQICVYCQRNWELSVIENEILPAGKKKLDNALSWFRSNNSVEEVLVTGGDPLIMSDERIAKVLDGLFSIPHIKRVRIGTRALVTVPMRFDEGLLEILKKYHRPPEKTINIVTHIQHPLEISEEMVEAVAKIKSLGIDILNQQVFTIQNCRKFETCFLREALYMIGVRPYYLFNLKGKDETKYFKVPLARLLQENKEEARLMPGILRTDKAVFNIPTLGKNYLGSWQDHDLIMILDNGSRVYEFYPWEKYMAPVDTYLFIDESIYDFLRRLEALGEDPEDYRTIWYYF